MKKLAESPSPILSRRPNPHQVETRTDQILQPKGQTRTDQSYQDETRSVALAATSSYKIDPNWYSDTGTTDHITRTWIISLCVNAIMEVNKFKSAMEQVCKFCIQVILQLILLLLLLHCVNPKEILLLWIDMIFSTFNTKYMVNPKEIVGLVIMF